MIELEMQPLQKIVDAHQERTHVKKPALSFWQIWNMSFGFLGIQFGFALQQANVPRILQTMGTEPDKIGYLMALAPIAGLLVQPIIGFMSDRTWGRWGRRRPYFIAGALFAALALCGMPHAPTLWAAAIVLLVLDVAINVAMEPFRAFVGDLLPKEQVTTGYAFQTFFIGIGAAIASALPYILTHAFGVSNSGPAGEVSPSVKLAFYLGAIAFFGAVAWTVFRTKEYSPEQVRQYHPEAELVEHSKGGFASFFGEYSNMPQIMKQLSLVQFFTWFTWFTMWTYATAAITQHIYHTTDTTSALFNEGADWWGICSAVYNAASIAFAFLLPVIARKTSRRAAHSVALAIGGMSFISMYFVTSPAMLVLPFVGVGLAWASTLSMPYAILACGVPAHKMGMLMGMFNMSIAFPQLVSGLTLGFLLSRFFGGQSIMMLVFAGVSMLIAACLSMTVKEPD